MIDIHSHILPGIDDGSPDIRSSLKMAEIAAEDGIVSMIATPHLTEEMSGGYIVELIKNFQKILDQNKIDLKIFKGAEIPFRMLREEKNLVTLADSEFILAEFFPDYVPEDAQDVFKSFLKQGYKIIIAHPERNIVFLKNNNKLKNLLLPGVYTQVTAMSIKGSFGPSIKMFSHYLLKKNMIDFIATDAHDAEYRIPNLSYLIKSKKNKKYYKELNKILNCNPEKIISNGY